MVKDSKQQASGSGDAAPATLLETSEPRVPSFENLQSEEQTAFSMSYDLLRYNLEQLRLPPSATADAEAEAEEASRQLLGDSGAVDSVLRPPGPAGSQLSTTSIGREMLQLADDFRTSRQGSEADRLANEVSLADMNAASFTAILEQLFHTGYNVESFVTLFHFVARLLQRAYVERGDSGFRSLCHNLMMAFLMYLVANLIKFLANMFRTLSQERRVAVLSFVSGLAIASAACALIFYSVLRNKK